MATSQGKTFLVPAAQTPLSSHCIVSAWCLLKRFLESPCIQKASCFCYLASRKSYCVSKQEVQVGFPEDEAKFQKLIDTGWSFNTSCDKANGSTLSYSLAPKPLQLYYSKGFTDQTISCSKGKSNARNSILEFSMNASQGCY